MSQRVMRVQKVYGYIVDEQWLADFALSYGVLSKWDITGAAIVGIEILERQVGVELVLGYTNSTGKETVPFVLAFYTNEDYDVEKECFPVIPREKIEKLAKLLERPGEEPKWFPHLGPPLE